MADIDDQSRLSIGDTCRNSAKLRGKQRGKRMAKQPDMADLLPTAEQAMQKLAVAEGEKASEAMRLRTLADAEKKALIDRLSKPSGLSDEEVMQRAARIIERAIGNGLSSVQVYRFPNSLCTDGGRAINQQEAGWDKTLTGIPKEIYDFWTRQLKPRGYKLRVEIIDFPGGIPGDVGMTLVWG